jgi:hypothetical protein
MKQQWAYNTTTGSMNTEHNLLNVNDIKFVSKVYPSDSIISCNSLRDKKERWDASSWI